jgi:hypothetical protein
MSVIKDSKLEGGLFSHADAALEAGQPTLKTSSGTPVSSWTRSSTASPKADALRVALVELARALTSH